jgi:hypothetical protein
VAKQLETFTQVNVSLPDALVAFLQREAARLDHTLSGTIRHIVASAARSFRDLGVFTQPGSFASLRRAAKLRRMSAMPGGFNRSMQHSS